MDKRLRAGLYALWYVIQNIGRFVNPVALFFSFRIDFTDGFPESEYSVTNTQF